jgi:hypothetical protein
VNNKLILTSNQRHDLGKIYKYVLISRAEKKEKNKTQAEKGPKRSAPL